MNALWLLSAWLAPIAVLPMLRYGSGRWLVPLAALPALAAALLVAPGTVVEIPWLLLGARVGLDASAGTFLLFGAVLWLIAGLYASFYLRHDRHSVRFYRFFLLAMSGNFGLIVGQDLVSFYLGFGLMGLAAYGLVVHDGNVTVRRAGRVYLVMTLIGELALFAGFLLLYQRTGSLAPTPEQLAQGVGTMELMLLVTAFGIKAGVVGLHFWLPLAHPAAPVPASAVLSGVMIKTALIGWIRYLPLGVVALPELGSVLVATGLLTAVVAIPLGLGQRDPKVVLAYSSIGKMGTMIAALGVAAADPALAPMVIAAITFYAAHHGLAKGALFLGVGVVKTRPGVWPLLVLALPALVLAGAPFTSGAAAKMMFKEAVFFAPSAWEGFFGVAIPLTAAGTLLLMARFLYLMWRASDAAPGNNKGVAVSWIVLVGLSLFLPLLYGGTHYVFSDAVMVLAGLTVAWWTAAMRPSWLTRWVGRVPPGDFIEPLLLMSRRIELRKEWTEQHDDARRTKSIELHWREWSTRFTHGLQVVESALGRRVVFAAAWLGLVAAAFLGVASW